MGGGWSTSFDLDNGGIEDNEFFDLWYKQYLEEAEEKRKQKAARKVRDKEKEAQQRKVRKYQRDFEDAVNSYWLILVSERVKDALKDLNNLEE